MGKLGDFFVKYPLMKGMAAYSILWPAANAIHQLRTKGELDPWAAIRYGLVGTTCVCPVFYYWLKFINGRIPGTNFKACVQKAVAEQVIYWPVAIPVFFGGINFYEGQSFDHFVQELKEKYVTTHLTVLCFFPFIMPFINYSNLIAPQNKTPIAATVSFLWASFLSWLKGVEVKGDPGRK